MKLGFFFCVSLANAAAALALYGVGGVFGLLLWCVASFYWGGMTVLYLNAADSR